MLKKLSAILLMLLLMFNWYGYRMVTDVLTQKADEALEARLDVNDYNEEELIEVRIPLDVPYVGDQPDFERHYGEVEANGKFYTYVKSKIDKGELVLKCIPNESKQNINAAGNDFFKNVNGLGHEQQGTNHNNNIQKNTISDYDDRIENFAVARILSTPQRDYALYTPIAFDQTSGTTPEQPPEFIG